MGYNVVSDPEKPQVFLGVNLIVIKPKLPENLRGHSDKNGLLTKIM